MSAEAASAACPILDRLLFLHCTVNRALCPGFFTHSPIQLLLITTRTLTCGKRKQVSKRDILYPIGTFCPGRDNSPAGGRLGISLIARSRDGGMGAGTMAGVFLEVPGKVVLVHVAQ